MVKSISVPPRSNAQVVVLPEEARPEVRPEAHQEVGHRAAPQQAALLAALPEAHQVVLQVAPLAAHQADPQVDHRGVLQVEVAVVDQAVLQEAHPAPRAAHRRALPAGRVLLAPLVGGVVVGFRDLVGVEAPRDQRLRSTEV